MFLSLRLISVISNAFLFSKKCATLTKKQNPLPCKPIRNGNKIKLEFVRDEFSV